MARVTFSTRLTTVEREKLNALSRYLEQPAGAVVRLLIRRATPSASAVLMFDGPPIDGPLAGERAHE